MENQKDQAAGRMTKQLKTITVNSLLEEISVCESLQTMVKIKKLAKTELEDADEDTKKTIERLINYKIRLINNKPLGPSFELPTAHWDLMAMESKLAMYENLTYLLPQADIDVVSQILDSRIKVLKDTNPDDVVLKKKLLSTQKALKGIKFRLELHLFDLGEINTKLNNSIQQ